MAKSKKKNHRKNKKHKPILNDLKKSHAANAYYDFGRSSRETTFINKKGEEKKLKTSLLIDKNKLLADNPTLNEKLYDSELLSTIKKSGTYRPISKVIGMSENDSPVRVCTPNNKTPLMRTSRIGYFSLFSNDPKAKEVLAFNPKKPSVDYKESDLAKKLVKSSTKIKSSSIVLTAASLNKVAKKNRKQKRRSISQNRVMTKKGVNEKFGSATLHARAAGIAPDNVYYNHCHLVAHGMQGEESQNKNNLVIGSKHSNTESMAIEKAVIDIVKNNKVKLNFTAQAKHTRHLALQQSYTIKAKKFKFDGAINPQTTNQPHSHQMFYVKEGLTLLYDITKANATTSTTSKSPTYTTFFDKKTLVKDTHVKKIKCKII